MGGNSSKVDKSFSSSLPENARFFGLYNYGNTCYCNSVLQALYFCTPFRDAVMSSAKERKANTSDPSLLSSLAGLFEDISSQRRNVGSLGPRDFIQCLRKSSEQFQSHSQQDAHEFLNFLLNDIATLVQKQLAPDSPMSEQLKVKTFIHDLFEGTLTNQTKCMCCETITSRDEEFLDLSVDVAEHSSLTACLSRFSSVEMLGGREKFYCNKCMALQEAQKRMLVKSLPTILTIHLKRFKFLEDVQRHRKLSCRVVFPFDLRLSNTVSGSDERLYQLFAVVVHLGGGPNHGHYVSAVRSHGHWVLFDDESVETITEEALQQYCFGSSQSTYTGYLLFYASTGPEGGISSSGVQEESASMGNATTVESEPAESPSPETTTGPPHTPPPPQPSTPKSSSSDGRRHRLKSFSLRRPRRRSRVDSPRSGGASADEA